MVEPLRHRQTKGAATDMFYLTPPRHISTLPNKRHRSRMAAQSAGDRKLKESAPWLAPGRPQPPPMGFDNRVADREAHAHAFGLGRVEWLEQTREVIWA